jgi:hypothetical protein
MVRRVWSALDGCLVFDIAINRSSEDNGPSLATVRCAPMGQPVPPGEAEEVVAIYPGRATWFNLKFRAGGYVYGNLQQRTHVHVDGVDSIGIAADIRFGLAGRYDETRFEGLMVVCPSQESPAPPEPGPPEPPLDPDPPDDDGGDDDGDDDAEDPAPRIADQLEELFPYVYVRRWPRIGADDLRFGFIAWADASPPGEAFVDQLAAAATLGRYAAEALAVWCIDGQAPYEGVFVSGLNTLSGPIREMADVAERLWRAGPPDADWSERVIAELRDLLGRHGETSAYFAGADYRAALERVWQSYFALVAVLGYDPLLLSEFSLCLWLAHVVAVATNVDAQGELIAEELTPRQRHAAANASVILPASAFPLPAAAPAAASAAAASPPGAEDLGWIEPFAIGDLQMVRHRLKRYAPGEIARIENIVRGERRETRSHRGRRVVELQQQTADDEQVLEADDGDTRSGLLEETQKIVAERSVTNNYQNFQTSYGPPTQATLNGSWTRTFNGAGAPGTTHDVTRFAREIVSTSANRISRRVSGVRATSSLTQVEDSVCSVFDNTGGEGNLRAVFRWLNKVYEASVVNYGSRLMMELLIRQPASDYLAGRTATLGHTPTGPMPLDRFGVRSFQDIGPESYARICAAYQVTDITPPPLASAFVTATLRGGEDKLLAIPTGYSAVDAFANCLSAPPGAPPPQVIVGRQAVTPGAPSQPLLPYGENVTIPVSVSGTSPGLSPPTDGGEVLVNVEVQCAPTARAMDEWRIGVYGALTKAHQDLMRRHAEHGPANGHSAQVNRRIERRELKAASVRLLMDRLVSLIGARAVAASPPSPFEINQPRYLQFLEEALEWPEMAYSFQAGASGGEVDDELFATFLAAQQARVLVPVRPDHVMAFLYFFTSGAVWEGPDGLVATINPAGRDGVALDEVALVNDLKHAARREGAPVAVGPCWEVVVPTSLQVIDEPRSDDAGGRLEGWNL